MGQACRFRSGELNLKKEHGMKRFLTFLFFLLIANSVKAEIKVISLKGEVFVRRDVQEEWVPVAVGDVLKPDDSMRLDGKSSAAILIDGTKTLMIPELVILDLSDVRELTQEELLLKLAM